MGERATPPWLLWAIPTVPTALLAAIFGTHYLWGEPEELDTAAEAAPSALQELTSGTLQESPPTDPQSLADFFKLVPDLNESREAHMLEMLQARVDKLGGELAEKWSVQALRAHFDSGGTFDDAWDVYNIAHDDIWDRFHFKTQFRNIPGLSEDVADNFAIRLGSEIDSIYYRHVSKPDHDDWQIHSANMEVFELIALRALEDHIESGGEASIEKYFEVSLDAVLHTLDPYSDYLTAQEYDQRNTEIEGKFDGLGIHISQTEGGIAVVAPIANTPAFNAGIRAGDLIVGARDLNLDDTGMSFVDYNINEAAQYMRGEPGTDIELYIQRGDNPEPITFAITRATIEVKPVSVQEIRGFAHIHINTFNHRFTARDFIAELVLLEHSENPPNGYVIDLRDNSGGLGGLDIDVADAFLELGIIEQTQENDGHLGVSRATSGDFTDGKPIVLLVNGVTASAAEVVANALREHGRVVVVAAESSFGKASGQRYNELYDHVDDSSVTVNLGAVKYTQYILLGPNGYSVQGIGVQPDILVQDDAITLTSVFEGSKPLSLANPNPLPHRDPVSVCSRSESDAGGDIDPDFVHYMNGRFDTELACAIHYLEDLTNVDQPYQHVSISDYEAPEAEYYSSGPE